MANKKVLIIGCGNIGALYDFKKEGIKTHVKAFVNSRMFDVTVFDLDKKLADTIAGHYNTAVLDSLEDSDLSIYDVVVIGTPTKTHFTYLEKLLPLHIPVIICEKPVTDRLENLSLIEALKRNSRSKVLVNYFRRFHPEYQKLKDFIKDVQQPLTNIQITYQRGFTNNATHAIDLLNFLLGDQPLEEVKVTQFAFDEFESDPTLTLTGTFNSVPVTIQGLQNVKHSYFELKFWFQTMMISIEQNGQSIRLFSAELNREFSFYLPLQAVASPFDNINAIDNAMQHLVELVGQYLENPELADNFDSSIQLNRQSLKIIESICHN